MPLQIGDRVRVVKFDDDDRHWPHMVGREGEILGFEDDIYNLSVEVAIDNLYGLMFSPDELELVAE